MVARVAGHQAVDVGPNPDFVRRYGGANEGGGVVGAAPAQRRDRPFLGLPREPCDHRDRPFGEDRGDPLLDLRVGDPFEGPGCPEVRIGQDSSLAPCEVGGRDSPRHQSARNDGGREPLAKGDDVVPGLGRDFPDVGDPGQDLLQLGDLLGQVLRGALQDIGIGYGVGRDLQVSREDGVREVLYERAVPELAAVRRSEEVLGDSVQRRDDRDQSMSLVSVHLDEVRDLAHPSPARDGSPSELHYQLHDHDPLIRYAPTLRSLDELDKVPENGTGGLRATRPPSDYRLLPGELRSERYGVEDAADGQRVLPVEQHGLDPEAAVHRSHELDDLPQTLRIGHVFAGHATNALHLDISQRTLPSHGPVAKDDELGRRIDSIDVG